MLNKNTHRGFRVWFVAAALALAGTSANAESDVTPDRMQSGSLLLKMQQGYRVATLMNTDVSITVSGLVARVHVRQSFENTGSDWAEGIYVFPLPDKAAVDHMRLHIGERFIEGEIREKAQARKEYEKAKSEGKKASLVEQQRPNLFTTSVANIAPGEKVVVEIEYLEDLVYDAGTLSLRFPLTITPRFIPGAPLPDRQGSGWSADTTQVTDASLITPPMVSSSNAHRATISVDIDAGLPLDRITSRYHAVNVVDSGNRYSIELASQTVPMDHDFELVWTPVAGAAPEALAFSETVDGDAHYLLMVMPPAPDELPETSMPREMIFVIDTSGSMHGTSIVQARKALSRALNELEAHDRFNVIEFNSRPRALFPGSVPVSAATIGNAERFVAGLKANGGTVMHTALQMALARPPVETHLRQLVFITDGAVGNEEALFSLIGDRLGSGRLFTVGIGSAPNSWFMRKAAEVGRGSHTFISATSEVGERMDRLFEKIRSPQVTNIRIAWPGGVTVDAYPPVVPDLYVEEPVTIRARVRGPLAAGDVVTISGDTVAGAWSRTLTLMPQDASPGIGALWARARIAERIDAGRRARNVDLHRDDVVATALKFHLVSKYTSLVAVDKTPARTAADALRRDQVPNLMAYGQSTNAIFGFPATATAAPRMLLTGIVCLLLALLLTVRLRPRRHALPC